MGGGNGQKSKMAREKNLEKAKGAKVSQLESNKKAMSIQCKVCMQTFMCTTSEVKCREHAEAKHPKSDVYACFPHLKKSCSWSKKVQSRFVWNIISLCKASTMIYALRRMCASE